MAESATAREGEEVWETTTDGRVWIPLDVRGREQAVTVGGRAGSRLRVRAIDREIAQDRCLDDDPFTNGLLKRVDADQQSDPRTASPNVLSTEDLMVGFSKNGMAFRSFVDKLSEFNARRMAEMAEMVDGSTSQVSYLREVVARFKVEGDTPTYREMRASGE